jgi:hypothetical protein
VNEGRGRVRLKNRSVIVHFSFVLAEFYEQVFADVERLFSFESCFSRPPVQKVATPTLDDVRFLLLWEEKRSSVACLLSGSMD